MKKSLLEIGIAITLASGLSGVAIAKPVAPTPKYTEILDMLHTAQSNKNTPAVRNALIEIGQIGHKENQKLSSDDVEKLSNLLKSLKVEPDKYSSQKEQAMSYMFSKDRTNPSGVKKIFATLIEIGVIGKNYHQVPNRNDALKLKKILEKSGLLQKSR